MRGGEQNMKKLLIVMMILVALALAGCNLFSTPEPSVVPVSAMKANVDAVLVEGGIAWSIENTGDVNIFKYVITFNVFYSMKGKDNVILEVTDYALGIGEKDEGILELVDYDTPETVSVSWELFD